MRHQVVRIIFSLHRGQSGVGLAVVAGGDLNGPIIKRAPNLLNFLLLLLLQARLRGLLRDAVRESHPLRVLLVVGCL